MTRGPDRDRLLDQQLRRALGATELPPPSDDCLDAETLASWMDGGLDPSAVALAERHVSSCARCQALAGVMARTAPEPAVAAPWWRRYRATWLIPLTAGAAAVVLWMVVPANRVGAPSAQPESMEARAEIPERPPAEPPSLREEAAQAETLRAEAQAAATPPAAPEAGAEPVQRFDQAAAKAAPSNEVAQADRQLADEIAPAERRQELASGRAAAAAVRPQAAEPLALGRGSAVASRVVVSPDPAIRWRLRDDGNVERSSDGGTTWDVSTTGASAALVAGSSPSADVCWVVGRGGTVLVSTDGRQWRRVPFPETIDLAGIQATDERTATVTAADGRMFRTVDAGRSWSPP